MNVMLPYSSVVNISVQYFMRNHSTHTAAAICDARTSTCCKTFACELCAPDSTETNHFSHSLSNSRSLCIYSLKKRILDYFSLHYIGSHFVVCFAIDFPFFMAIVSSLFVCQREKLNRLEFTYCGMCDGRARRTHSQRFSYFFVILFFLFPR